MRPNTRLFALLLASAAVPVAAQNAPAPAPAKPEAPALPVPAALTAEQMPPVPLELAARVRPYLESRGAGFAGWDPNTRAVLINTRFANVSQLHRVAMPMGARTQISFEAEPVSGSYAPTKGDVLLVTKDRGGDEYYQLHTLKDGRLALLTDGKSRNEPNAWSKDGELVAFSSTRRNGVDSDLYVMDPRNPASARIVHESKGGGWALIAFAPGNARAYVADYKSVQDVDLYTLDFATGAMTAIGDPKAEIAYSGLEIAPDGTLWVTSDQGSDFQRLGRLDPASGTFTPVSKEQWDVDSFDISDDGKTIVYEVNEAGSDRMRILDVASGKVTKIDALPAGQIGGIEIAPWGEIGFSFNSAKSAADVWSLDPKTMQITRWTQSETGGLDPSVNAEPRIVTTKSFDGLEVSGLLYLPDPAKFPGKRPLIVDIHGGPEGPDGTPGAEVRRETWGEWSARMGQQPRRGHGSAAAPPHIELRRAEGSGGEPRVMVFSGPEGLAELGGAFGEGGPGQRIEIVRVGGPGGENDLDTDNDGKISEAEFSAPLRQAFARMDVDRSGFIEAGERGTGHVSEVFVHGIETRQNSED
jgi:dipeptidyl aminopeptidase/acylaminoacyl peptidase